MSETNWTEEIKSIITPAIDDIDNAPKGEFTLVSPSRNLRILISNAKTITKRMFDDFEVKCESLHPAVGLFIATQTEQTFNVKRISSGVIFAITPEDLTERFLDYLENLPIIENNEEDQPSRRTSKSAPGKTSQNKSEQKNESHSANTSSRKGTPSVIDDYGDTPEEFERYCREVPKSKVEFKKAQAKWAEQMKDYPKLTDFKEYVDSMKPPKKEKEKEEKPEANGTIEEFEQYLIDTPASQIRKTYIKEHFGNLDNSITFLNETGKDFLQNIKDYQKALKGK